MDEASFWSLIETTRPDDRGCEEHASRVEEQLVDLPPAEITAFAQHLRTQLNRAYTWDLWGAAYVINGGCSDDGFEYFRGWLVLQGRQVFDRAVDDPETLADVARPDVECEDILYVPFSAYKTTTGQDLSRAGFPAQSREPAGKEWVEEDLPGRFPRLTAAFG